MTRAFPGRLNGRVEELFPADRGLAKSIRVGLIGYGYWGSKHTRVLAGLPGVQLTVIEDRPDRLREAITRFPAINIASRLGEVQDELDAVVIATPPCSHGPIAMQALEAG